jgi:carbonic anhydrase
MPSRKSALAPREALDRLRAGNARFIEGVGAASRAFDAGLAEGQSPFAVVLGCADSRAPAEYVFDQGLGDLFVIRVAGNIVAPSLAGSVEFAASKFGTRLVVVMGHTHCGAIASTAYALEHGGELESPNLRSIVGRITPHVEHLFVGEGDHDARLAAATRANAIASARELRSASEIISGFVASGAVMVVPAVFDLATGAVEFFEHEAG